MHACACMHVCMHVRTYALSYCHANRLNHHREQPAHPLAAVPLSVSNSTQRQLAELSQPLAELHRLQCLSLLASLIIAVDERSSKYRPRQKMKIVSQRVCTYPTHRASADLACAWLVVISIPPYGHSIRDPTTPLESAPKPFGTLEECRQAVFEAPLVCLWQDRRLSRLRLGLRSCVLATALFAEECAHLPAMPDHCRQWSVSSAIC